MIEAIINFLQFLFPLTRAFREKKLVLAGVKNAQDLVEFENRECWFYVDPRGKIQAALFGCAWVG